MPGVFRHEHFHRYYQRPRLIPTAAGAPPAGSALAHPQAIWIITATFMLLFGEFV
jgi:hypothetical protein